MDPNQESYYNRVMAQMDALDELAAEYHTNENIRAMFRARLAAINNTDGYLTGNRVLDCRSIQMFDPEDWVALFGPNEPMRPYVQRCMDYTTDETRTVPYPGELEVSLLLEENANPMRPGTHRAVFLVFVTPHQQFESGHIIEVEYGEGSNTQEAINRLFHVDAEEETHAIVQQFTEYQILAFLADENQMNNLLHTYFLDGFNPMRFVDEDAVMDPADAWRVRHACVNVVNVVLHNGVDPNVAPPVPVPAAAVVPVAIPPPPPVNDFAAIYRENYNAAAAVDNEDNDEHDIWGIIDAINAAAVAAAAAEEYNNIINNNVDQYNYNYDLERG